MSRITCARLPHPYNKMAAFDAKKHKLEGTSGEESGGLILSKKRSKPDDGGTFKKPTGSLLGLDALAREKRKQRELKESAVDEPVDKKRKPGISSRKNEDTSDSRGYGEGRVRISFGSGHSRNRQYRYVCYTASPTHPTYIHT